VSDSKESQNTSCRFFTSGRLQEQTLEATKIEKATIRYADGGFLSSVGVERL